MTYSVFYGHMVERRPVGLYWQTTVLYEEERIWQN